MQYVQRVKSDVFLLMSWIIVGTTVLGASILFIFMLLAAPSVIYSFLSLAVRGLVIAVLAGVISTMYLYPFVRSLYGLARTGPVDEGLSEKDSKALRLWSLKLPFRMLIMTLILWPASTFAIGLWMYAADVLSFSDGMRIGLTGILYAPLQGLIMFYAVRTGLRPMAREMSRLGLWSFDYGTGGLTIRVKLIISFICLAVVPLLAGAFLSDVQRERQEVRNNLLEVCQALDYAHAEGPADLDFQAWQEAVKEGPSKISVPEQTKFMVANRSGRFLVGREVLDGPARHEWKEMTASQEQGCQRRPVPGSRRFILANYYSDPGVWIGSVTDPSPLRMNLTDRFGGALILGLLVMALGLALGLLAARDVSESVRSVEEAAEALSSRDEAVVDDYLPGDELGALAMRFKDMSRVVRESLDRSEGIVSGVRDLALDLGQSTTSLKELADRQTEVVGEQGSLTQEALGGAEEVTMAAGDIKERAHNTDFQMNEVSGACGEAEGLLRRMSKTIYSINESSSKIEEQMQVLEANYRRMEEVVKIIDDISERTEILALNATLEARGEEGQGERFSVVASEVQRLSERIAEQTSDIRRLFSEIRRSSLEMAQIVEIGREKAQEGPEWITKVGQSLKSIKTRAKTANESMEEITRMAERQSSSLEQMKIVVSEVRSVASVLEEISSGMEDTVENLNGLSEKMIFTVAEAETGKDRDE